MTDNKNIEELDKYLSAFIEWKKNTDKRITLTGFINHHLDSINLKKRGNKRAEEQKKLVSIFTDIYETKLFNVTRFAYKNTDKDTNQHILINEIDFSTKGKDFIKKGMFKGKHERQLKEQSKSAITINTTFNDSPINIGSGTQSATSNHIDTNKKKSDINITTNNINIPPKTGSNDDSPTATLQKKGIKISIIFGVIGVIIAILGILRYFLPYFL